MYKWKNWVGAFATVVLLTVSSCASWTPEQNKYVTYGAAGGALVGGAIGCGIAAGVDYDDPTSYAIGCPIGIGAGAIIGGILGYYYAPKPVPPPPPPPIPQKLVLRGVHFDFNKAIIRPGDAAVLDEAVTILKANPGVVIDVNGYCDAIGGIEYNQRLSERRGNAVANYLLNGGIQATQLRVHGYGKTGFVATNRTAEGRAQNRRVELVPEQ